MGKVIIFSIISSLPLLLGAFLGIHWKPNKKVTGIFLAFASGTLISAASFELFKKAYELGGHFVSAFALIAGAIVFTIINTYIDRKIDAKKGAEVGHREKMKKGSSAIGWGLIAGVTLDGVPENLALGLSIQESGGLALLAAVFVSNFPESLVGSIAMHKSGSSTKFIMGVWGATSILLSLSVIAGGAFAMEMDPKLLAGFLAFAGGAIIASLADTLMPEAFEHGKPLNAIATALGFFVAFFIAHN